MMFPSAGLIDTWAQLSIVDQATAGHGSLQSLGQTVDSLRTQLSRVYLSAQASGGRWLRASCCAWCLYSRSALSPRATWNHTGASSRVRPRKLI